MNNKIDETQILEADTVNDFLGEYNIKTTIQTHKWVLKTYFTFINVDPDKYVIDIRLLGKNKKIKAIDQYEKDITNFKKYLVKEDYAPRSIHDEISSIKMFLEYHRIDLDNTFWNRLKKRSTKGKGTITDFKIPSSQDLKKILTYGNVRTRAMFLLQATSGMRIGEICALKLPDIDLSYKYPHIIIRKSKTGVKGRTRCSPEAKAAIEDWLKIRDQSYETTLSRSSRGYRKSDDKNRLFPITAKMARNMWNRMLEKSGFTEKDNSGKIGQYLMGTHVNRKYFRSEFSKYDNELAKYLMNQRTPLDRTYRDWSDEYLDKEYAKGVKYLLVFEKGEDHEQLEKFERYKQEQGQEMLDMKNDIVTLKDKWADARMENKQLREKLEVAFDVVLYEIFNLPGKTTIGDKYHSFQDYRERIEKKALERLKADREKDKQIGIEIA